MAFFIRKKKQTQGSDDLDQLSALGDDPESWDDLDDEELNRVIGVKFIEYGSTQDGSWIAGLFALHRHTMERLYVDERREMFTLGRSTFRSCSNPKTAMNRPCRANACRCAAMRERFVSSLLTSQPVDFLPECF